MNHQQDFNYNKPKIQKYNLSFTLPEIDDKEFPLLSDKYKRFQKRQNNQNKTTNKPNIEKRVWNSENFEWEQVKGKKHN